MSSEAQRARGERFRLWYAEDGLQDTVARLRAVYIERIAALEPHDAGFADKARVLAVAAKIVDQVEAQFLAVIANGQLAAANIEHVAKIEKLGSARRRFF